MQCFVITVRLCTKHYIFLANLESPNKQFAAVAVAQDAAFTIFSGKYNTVMRERTES